LTFYLQVPGKKEITIGCHITRRSACSEQQKCCFKINQGKTVKCKGFFFVRSGTESFFKQSTVATTMQPPASPRILYLLKGKKKPEVAQ